MWTPYFIEITLNQDREVIKGHCSCVSGTDAICKHSSAVAHYINMERPTSSTSSTAKWFEPSEYSKAKFPKGCTMTKIFYLKEEEPVSFSSPCSEDIDKFVKLCQVNNATSISLYKTLTAIPEEPPSSSLTRAFPPCDKDLFLDPKCPIVTRVKSVKRGKKTFPLGNIENCLEPELSEFWFVCWLTVWLTDRLREWENEKLLRRLQACGSTKKWWFLQKLIPKLAEIYFEEFLPSLMIKKAWKMKFTIIPPDLFAHLLACHKGI